MSVLMNACEMLSVVVATCMAVGECRGDDEKFDPTPQTPTAFETRNTGGTLEEEPDLQRKKGKKVTLKFTALTDSREWQDQNGKVIKARLLAFEKTKPDADTVIQDGKVRLLVDGATVFSVFPVAKLSDEDQVFVRNLAAVRKQGETKSD